MWPLLILSLIGGSLAILQANSEVSALLGRIPSAVGYQPTLATDLGGLQERITTTKKGSITSVQAIYVPADDLTDPAPATTFAHLDATTVLSRQVFSWINVSNVKTVLPVVSFLIFLLFCRSLSLVSILLLILLILHLVCFPHIF